MLSLITPVILTHHEAPNIGRNLEKLSWAKEVIVVDSLSTDDTERIVRSFPNARFIQRVFGSHASQWNFALKETGIKTEWVLALDADHILTDKLVEELKCSALGNFDAYEARFLYCIAGRRLRASVYPPSTVLFKKDKAHFEQVGHTQKISVEGSKGRLFAPILHDDRKPFSRWWNSQKNYMKLEVTELTHPGRALSWPDRVRQLRIVAPVGVFVYCLLWKGLILDGIRGIVYSAQRMIAEGILSFYLIRHDLNRTTMRP